MKYNDIYIYIYLGVDSLHKRLDNSSSMLTTSIQSDFDVIKEEDYGMDVHRPTAEQPVQVALTLMVLGVFLTLTSLGLIFRSKNPYCHCSRRGKYNFIA